MSSPPLDRWQRSPLSDSPLSSPREDDSASVTARKERAKYRRSKPPRNHALKKEAEADRTDEQLGKDASGSRARRSLQDSSELPASDDSPVPRSGSGILALNLTAIRPEHHGGSLNGRDAVSSPREVQQEGQPRPPKTPRTEHVSKQEREGGEGHAVMTETRLAILQERSRVGKRSQVTLTPRSVDTPRSGISFEAGWNLEKWKAEAVWLREQVDSLEEKLQAGGGSASEREENKKLRSELADCQQQVAEASRRILSFERQALTWDAEKASLQQDVQGWKQATSTLNMEAKSEILSLQEMIAREKVENVRLTREIRELQARGPGRSSERQEEEEEEGAKGARGLSQITRTLEQILSMPAVRKVVKSAQARKEEQKEEGQEGTKQIRLLDNTATALFTAMLEFSAATERNERLQQEALRAVDELEKKLVLSESHCSQLQSQLQATLTTLESSRSYEQVMERKLLEEEREKDRLKEAMAVLEEEVERSKRIFEEVSEEHRTRVRLLEEQQREEMRTAVEREKRACEQAISLLRAEHGRALVLANYSLQEKHELQQQREEALLQSQEEQIQSLRRMEEEERKKMLSEHAAELEERDKRIGELVLLHEAELARLQAEHEERTETLKRKLRTSTEHSMRVDADLSRSEAEKKELGDALLSSSSALRALADESERRKELEAELEASRRRCEEWRQLLEEKSAMCDKVSQMEEQATASVLLLRSELDEALRTREAEAGKISDLEDGTSSLSILLVSLRSHVDSLLLQEEDEKRTWERERRGQEEERRRKEEDNRVLERRLREALAHAQELDQRMRESKETKEELKQRLSEEQRRGMSLLEAIAEHEKEQEEAERELRAARRELSECQEGLRGAEVANRILQGAADALQQKLRGMEEEQKEGGRRSGEMERELARVHRSLGDACAMLAASERLVQRMCSAIEELSSRHIFFMQEAASRHIALREEMRKKEEERLRSRRREEELEEKLCKEEERTRVAQEKLRSMQKVAEDRERELITEAHRRKEEAARREQELRAMEEEMVELKVSQQEGDRERSTLRKLLQEYAAGREELEEELERKKAHAEVLLQLSRRSQLQREQGSSRMERSIGRALAQGGREKERRSASGLSSPDLRRSIAAGSPQGRRLQEQRGERREQGEMQRRGGEVVRRREGGGEEKSERKIELETLLSVARGVEALQHLASLKE